MEQRFTSAQVVKLTGITPRQLQWWDERGIVQPEREGRRRLYAFEDLTEIAVIPPKTNRKAVIDFDRDMYRWRHLIENTFAELKEFRAVATRYDKTDTSYAATVHLAAAVIASR